VAPYGDLHTGHVLQHKYRRPYGIDNRYILLEQLVAWIFLAPAPRKAKSLARRPPCEDLYSTAHLDKVWLVLVEKVIDTPGFLSSQDGQVNFFTGTSRSPRKFPENVSNAIGSFSTANTPCNPAMDKPSDRPPHPEKRSTNL